jgi:hypothetical protein
MVGGETVSPCATLGLRREKEYGKAMKRAARVKDRVSEYPPAPVGP